VTSPDEPAGDTAEDAARPPLVVVRGEANEEEVAALTAVVAAIASQASAVPAPQRRVSQWASRARLVRGAHVAGPGGWRASGLPR
jgi:hypothetical protein